MLAHIDATELLVGERTLEQVGEDVVVVHLGRPVDGVVIDLDVGGCLHIDRMTDDRRLEHAVVNRPVGHPDTSLRMTLADMHLLEHDAIAARSACRIVAASGQSSARDIDHVAEDASAHINVARLIIDEDAARAAVEHAVRHPNPSGVVPHIY